jgi:hypothetical protein
MTFELNFFIFDCTVVTLISKCIMRSNENLRRVGVEKSNKYLDQCKV